MFLFTLLTFYLLPDHFEKSWPKLMVEPVALTQTNMAFPGSLKELI